MRILVVEDEQKVANALREGLEGERYDVAVERTGEGAFFRLTTEAFDLILLDLGLPGRDGVEILTALRQKGIKTPVLVLTARDTLDDRVAGLDTGADDYLVKPFAFAELLARIRALLRRGRAADAPPAKSRALWQRFKAAHDVIWARCEAYFAEQAGLAQPHALSTPSSPLRPLETLLAALPKDQDGDTVPSCFCGKVNHIRCLRFSFNV